MCIIISDTVKAGHGKYPAFSAVMHLKEAAGTGFADVQAVYGLYTRWDGMKYDRNGCISQYADRRSNAGEEEPSFT